MLSSIQSFNGTLKVEAVLCLKWSQNREGEGSVCPSVFKSNRLPFSSTYCAELKG